MSTIPPSGIPLTKAEEDSLMQERADGAAAMQKRRAAAMDVPTALDLDAVKARFALTRDVGADHVLRPEEIRTLAESIADIPALLSELSRLTAAQWNAEHQIAGYERELSRYKQEAEAMRPVVERFAEAGGDFSVATSPVQFVEVPAWRLEAMRHVIMGTEGKTRLDEVNIAAIYKTVNDLVKANRKTVASDWEREREAQMLALVESAFRASRTPTRTPE